MCGIAGIVGTELDAVVEATTIERMCRTIVHRGPDDEGIFVKGPVGLGMRRLSIIDLGGGHQPIFNEDKTVWIVFNGEIYNFLELRPELEKLGHRFSTDTDTEVIVHLYEEFGSNCVQKLRGMFAFAIYDERRRKLLLARDRLGEKPIHYAVLDGQLLFGSEIKALLAVAPELKEINYEGLLQFFYFGYIPDPCTAFLRIHKLPPGHLLEFTNSQVNVRQYWDLPAYGTHEPGSEEECLEELEHHLAEAVRMQLMSDVPLGALLSGGVDSSTIVALMARRSSKPVKTFSIGFPKGDFNEAQHARAVAKRFGTDHHELIVEPNFAETLETLTHVLDEPFADSSILPTYYVSRLARQHVTVALSGDGGDELFAGYDRYLVHHRRRLFNSIPSWAGRLYRNHIYGGLPSSLPGRKFAYNVSLSPPERYVDGLSFLPAFDREKSLFSDEFLTRTRTCRNPRELFLDYWNRAVAGDLLSRSLYLDTKTYLPADVLTKVDRMSMAASLEIRVPILDHVFVELVTRLPVNWKFNQNTRKYIFKKLAERVGVPSEVLHRPKQGFAMPLVHWMRDEMRGDLSRLLLEPRTLQRGYWKPSAVRRMLEEHFDGRRDHSSQIWLLLVFELWHRNYLEKSDAHDRLPIYDRAPIVASETSFAQKEMPAGGTVGAGKTAS